MLLDSGGRIALSGILGETALMQIQLAPMLYFAQNCTLCGRALTAHPNAADDENTRDARIAIRGEAPADEQRAAVCPKCGKITHNKRAIKKIEKFLKTMSQDSDG